MVSDEKLGKYFADLRFLYNFSAVLAINKTNARDEYYQCNNVDPNPNHLHK